MTTSTSLTGLTSLIVGVSAQPAFLQKWRWRRPRAVGRDNSSPRLAGDSVTPRLPLSDELPFHGEQPRAFGPHGSFYYTPLTRTCSRTAVYYAVTCSFCRKYRLTFFNNFRIGNLNSEHSYRGMVLKKESVR